MMEDEEKRVTPQQIGSLGVGLVVTVGASILTSLVTPILFPFNFLISLALGGTAAYGALKVLDPRSGHDIFEARADARYKQMLREIAEIAVRIGDAGHDMRSIGPEVSQQLDHITRMIGMILDRYLARDRDHAGVSATLLILQKFDEVLAHYLKVKRGELFFRESQREKEIAETELQVIPMFELALENLGMKLDAGESLDKAVSRGTLESMLQSLDLIESLSAQIDSSKGKGNPDV